MLPEIGLFALTLTLALAMIQTLFALLGATWRIPNWIALARPATYGQFTFMFIAYSCLTYAFIFNDFSVSYVAQNSNSQLPLIYRIVSVWGGHEGSLLLWAFILSGWMVAVALFSHSLPREMIARVLGVMSFVQAGFLLFMIITSNPFTRLANPPIDGNDLNPLLQDVGLIIHPPMLYMGYVGFSVVFAFAIAALLSGKLDSAWARWSRPWTLIAWVFLTLGITLGSWWAYYELGWGGWWFWDPVENASFMPWLVGTALLHSLAVTEKRNLFKAWTVLLAIFAFSLSLLGTFLVRSGVLTSVHAFANDPERGMFILGFLAVIVGLSLVLYAWRAPTVNTGGSFSLFSKESLLLTNNILLVVACASILLGTLYPLFLDALGFDKISVGPPYFDTIFFLLMLPLVLLLAIGPMTRWQQENPQRILMNVRLSLFFTLVLSFAIPILLVGWKGFNLTVTLALAFWIMIVTVQNTLERLMHKPNKLQGFMLLPSSVHGMNFAHIGVAIFIIGVGISNSFSIEKDVRIQKNVELEVAGYQFNFQELEEIQGPNYTAERAKVSVSYQNETVAVLYPEKRFYHVRSMPMTETAIDVNLFRDVYISLGEPLGGGAWSARIYYKPFIRWVWLGAILMALGATLSASDRRYRQTLKKNATVTVSQTNATA